MAAPRGAMWTDVHVHNVRDPKGEGDIDMIELEINLTWPDSLPLSTTIDGIDPGDVKIISPSKATWAGNRLTIDHAFGHGNRVCDDDRHRITRRDTGPLECCDPHIPRAPFERTLVIVMESPHKHEYQLDCIDRPIGPAQGQTGRNIRDHFMSVLGSFPRILDHLDQQTRVIVANPIQFQTSLAAVVEVGKKWRKIRDAVWDELWCLQAIRKDFEDRLRRYSPHFVINACTVGRGRRAKIEDFLRRKLRVSVSRCSTSHPYRWTAAPILRSSPLTAATLNGTTLTLTLPNKITFADRISTSDFDPVTDIPGVRVTNVTRVNDTTARLTLGFSGHLTAVKMLAVRVRAGAMVGGNGTPSRQPRTSAALSVRPGPLSSGR